MGAQCSDLDLRNPQACSCSCSRASSGAGDIWNDMPAASSKRPSAIKVATKPALSVAFSKPLVASEASRNVFAKVRKTLLGAVVQLKLFRTFLREKYKNPKDAFADFAGKRDKISRMHFLAHCAKICFPGKPAWVFETLQDGKSNISRATWMQRLTAVGKAHFTKDRLSFMQVASLSVELAKKAQQEASDACALPPPQNDIGIGLTRKNTAQKLGEECIRRDEVASIPTPNSPSRRRKNSKRSEASPLPTLLEAKNDDADIKHGEEHALGSAADQPGGASPKRRARSSSSRRGEKHR